MIHSRAEAGHTDDVATKTEHLHVRISEDDAARIEALVAHYEMSAAQVVRMLIKRDFDAWALRAPKKTRR